MKSDFNVLKKTLRLFEAKTQFKFIVSNTKDYQYAKKIISSFLHGASNVIFQPEWGSRKFVKELVDLVKKDSIQAKTILQQQKIIWGVRKGV
jgi:hypothetical protein